MRECFHSSHISHLVILMKASIHGLSHQIHLMHPLVCVCVLGSSRQKACEGKRTPFSQQLRELLRGVVSVIGSWIGKSICGVNDRVIFLGCCSLAYATIGVTK